MALTSSCPSAFILSSEPFHRLPRRCSSYIGSGNLPPRAAICFLEACPVPKAISIYIVPAYREDALTPEIVDPRIADVEALARWLDYAFRLPGGFRFGLAGIIGLIPGIGDVLDAVVSLYIVIRALQLGVPRVTLARMLLNIGIEGLAGSVPLVGDLFDVAFKANRRNYRLLLKHVSQPRRQSIQDWFFLFLTLLLVLAGIAAPVFVLIVLVKRI
jgi:hypothetical protein